jgi:hypothetical protein
MSWTYFKCSKVERNAVWFKTLEPIQNKILCVQDMQNVSFVYLEHLARCLNMNSKSAGLNRKAKV